MLHHVEKSPSLALIGEKIATGEDLLLEGLSSSEKALLLALASKQSGKHLLILTCGGQEEMRLYQDFPLFSRTPLQEFPAWETLPQEGIAPSQDIIGERFLTLSKIMHGGGPHLLLAPLQSALQKVIGKQSLEMLSVHVKKGDELSFQALIEKLLQMGYRRETIVTDKGQMAVRGGIIDLFPPSSFDPFRIEFFGDEVESVRTFDPVGQKSIKQVDSIDILPGDELALTSKEGVLVSLLDYLGKDTIVVFDDLLALEDRFSELIQLHLPKDYFLSIEAFLEETSTLQKIFFPKEPIDALSDVVLEGGGRGYYSAKGEGVRVGFELFNRPQKALKVPVPFCSLEERFQTEEGGEALLKAFEKEAFSNETLFFLFDKEVDLERFKKKVDDQALSFPRSTHYCQGYLSSGFSIPDIQLTFFPETELTHRVLLRRQKQRSTYHTTPVEVFPLEPEDLVVHYHHGIGKFIKMEVRPNHLGQMSEFFVLEYADQGRLFVPIQQAYLINKYIGAHEETPKLHTLGASRWKKTRDETQKAILGYAKDLLDLYARREIKGGFVFSQDSEDLLAFEEEFPFIETEDQLAAIRDIKADMCSKKAMDRLVLGDVGYGKTEVAMRAAFKAVVDGGKQVAVLVPTTVLAMQHFDNFKERMQNFPVRIGVLSRFLSPKHVKKTLDEVKAGSCDIIIGTHRLVSEDVSFKDLGLIIIDEEQRFGVKAKEHLKKVRAGVDCLTLSATPIPRTLYMSLVGARDMSVVASPPQDRLPIKTVIAEPSAELIKNALLRELSRDGQVYYIHNRVESILEAASKLKELVPHATILVAHGSMSAEELDAVFHAFKSGKADILVATTIVENGIDIPNANTILIDRADRFGLAELYQLRGRVGRWNRRAFAYFLVPRLKSLPELAGKRLNALAESSGYGAGMKLAMRDLEIRGAGDLLGLEQSGHVSSIGFHLYCKMLKRTIKALQGGKDKRQTEVKLEMPFDARLPEKYVSEVSLRMEIYQRLGEAATENESLEIQQEVTDRFGTPPIEARWLFALNGLKIFLESRGYTQVRLEKTSLYTESLVKGETVVRRALFKAPASPEEFLEKIQKTLLM